jgi:hypothetical protein
MMGMSSIFFTGKLGTDELAASTLGNIVTTKYIHFSIYPLVKLFVFLSCLIYLVICGLLDLQVHWIRYFHK